MTSFAITALLIAVLIYSAATDLRERLIYNIAPFIVLTLFILSIVFSAQSIDLSAHFMSFAIASLIGCALFYSGLMGGGDVKLYAALAIHYPVTSLLDLSMAIVIFGALLGLLFAVLTYAAPADSKVSVSAQSNSVAESRLRTAFKTPIPYGCAILLGHMYVTLSLVHFL